MQARVLQGDCSCSCSRDPTAALQVINLAQPQVAYKTIVSPLKYQTRCLTTFPDKTGYLVLAPRPVSPYFTLHCVPAHPELLYHAVNN